MKKKGITRNLAKEVASRVRTESVRTLVRTKTGEMRTNIEEDDEAIVSGAVERGAAVVRGHQDRSARIAKVIDRLTDNLQNTLDNLDAIQEEIEEKTKDDNHPKRRNDFVKAVSLKELSTTALTITNAAKNVQSMDRESYSLDADQVSDTQQTIADILKQIDGTSKGLPNE